VGTKERIQKLYEDYENAGSTSSPEFSKLISELIPVCKSYLRHNMNQSLYTKEDVEDVAMMSIEKVLMSIKTYKRKSGFLSWVGTICRNTLISYYNKYTRQSILGVREFNGIDSMVRSDENLVYDMLPAHKDRDIFIKKMNGMSYKEISIETGINPIAIKTRVFRYKNNIKKYISNEIERIS